MRWKALGIPNVKCRWHGIPTVLTFMRTKCLKIKRKPIFIAICCMASEHPWDVALPLRFQGLTPSFEFNVSKFFDVSTVHINVRFRQHIFFPRLYCLFQVPFLDRFHLALCFHAILWLARPQLPPGLEARVRTTCHNGRVPVRTGQSSAPHSKSQDVCKFGGKWYIYEVLWGDITAGGERLCTQFDLRALSLLRLLL